MSRYDYEKVIGSLKNENVIKIGIQKETEMASVDFNDKCIMCGNFWDFHPDCHGITSIPSFRSPAQLAETLKSYCLAQNKKATIVRDENWKYPY